MRLSKTIIFVTSVLFLIISVFPASAKLEKLSGECETLGIQCGEGGASDVADILVSVIDIFLGLIALIAAAMIIYAGFMYITSGGDEKRAETAKKIILYAVIGLLVIGLSAVIVNFVLTSLGVGGNGAVT